MPQLTLLVVAAILVAGVYELLTHIPKMPGSVALGIAFFVGTWFIFFGARYVSS